jgi:hypothetical protein
MGRHGQYGSPHDRREPAWGKGFGDFRKTGVGHRKTLVLVIANFIRFAVLSDKKYAPPDHEPPNVF